MIQIPDYVLEGAPKSVPLPRLIAPPDSPDPHGPLGPLVVPLCTPTKRYKRVSYTCTMGWVQAINGHQGTRESL